MVNTVPIFVLFDLGASHTFIAISCASRVGLPSSILCLLIVFGQLLGNRATFVKAYCDVSLDFIGVPLFVELIEIHLDNFDVILGMD